MLLDGNCGDADQVREDEDDVIYCVDQATLLGLKQFYDKDPDIQVGRRRKLHETFRAQWSVGVWDEAQEREIRRLTHLDNAQCKKLLRDFMTQAHDYLVLFQFVGYYCVKDMADWLARLAQQQAEEPWREMEELPFGVVQLGLNLQDCYGKFQLVQRAGSPRRQLMFACDDEAMAARYNFYVFDQGANFEPLMDARRLTDPNADLVVLTPFMELYNRRCEIEEVRTCLLDAHFQRTHPESFVLVKPLPETPIERLAEPVRWGFDTLAEASQSASARRVELNASVAQEQLVTLQYESRLTARRTPTLQGMSAASSLTQELKARFGRTDMKETLKVLPESMELARGPEAAPLVNVEELQRRYEAEICSAMDVPQSFLRPTPQPARGNLPGSTDKSVAGAAFDQKELEVEVEKQQGVFQALFAEVYRHSFGQLVEHQTPRGQRPRLNFVNVAAKSDAGLVSLLPLVMAGVLGDDEYRRLLLHNRLADDKESAPARAERKKRLAAHSAPKGNNNNNNNSTQKQPSTSPKSEKKSKKKPAASSSSASAKSSASRSSSSEDSEARSTKNSKPTKKKNKRSTSSSGSSASTESESEAKAKKPKKKAKKD